jgi:4-amino-4-deoxychorismate lyase
MSWVDGRVADRIPTADRGLQYGDGLFETISCLGGRPRWLQRHLARLRSGCERLRIGFTAFEALASELTAAAAGQERCILKLILTRGSARRRGYRPVGDETPRCILERHPWPTTPGPVESPRDFRVGISGVRLGINPALAGMKHLNRLEQVLAQQELDGAELEEVVMLSSDGHVIGGSMSNLFLADETGLRTPTLDDCGTAGIVRGILCEAAERAGRPVRIQRIAAAELERVQEAFVTNVRWGVQPISVLAGRRLTARSHAQMARQWLDRSVEADATRG